MKRRKHAAPEEEEKSPVAEDAPPVDDDEPPAWFLELPAGDDAAADERMKEAEDYAQHKRERRASKRGLDSLRECGPSVVNEVHIPSASPAQRARLVEIYAAEVFGYPRPSDGWVPSEWAVRLRSHGFEHAEECRQEELRPSEAG